MFMFEPLIAGREGSAQFRAQGLRRVWLEDVESDVEFNVESMQSGGHFAACVADKALLKCKNKSIPSSSISTQARATSLRLR